MAAKKAKIRQPRPAVKPTEEPPRWPYRVIWALAGLGIGLSLFLTYHHYSDGGGGGLYARFCGGEGSYINCNAVLTSPYSYLFGLPLALWGLGTYLAMLGFTLIRRVGAMTLVAAFAVGVSLYLAGVSFFVIRALCVFCITLYVTNAGLFLCTLYLLWRSGKVVVSRLAYAAVGGTATVAALGWWQVMGEGSIAATSLLKPLGQGTRRGEAEFIQWYNARPAVAVGGEERHVEGTSDAAVTVVEFIDFR